jgi:hypothetical protein
VTGQTEILVLMKRSSSYVEHVKKYGLKATSRGVRPVSTTLPNPSSTAATAAVATAAAAAPGSAPAAVSVSAAPAIAAVSSRGPTNVAFGVARGACASEGCDCALYRWDAGSGDGGPCQNCLAPDHEILTSEGFVGRCEMEARFEAMLRAGPSCWWEPLRSRQARWCSSGPRAWWWRASRAKWSLSRATEWICWCALDVALFVCCFVC